MSQARIRYLIAKHRAGEISADEREELDTYWQASVRGQRQVDFLDETEKSALRETMFQQISQQIAPSHRLSPNKRSYHLVAAVVSLLIVMAGLLWLFPLQSARMIYATTYGETRQILLPDSSVVTLNANSQLEIPSDWNPQTASRQVWLQGEAFFEVRHAADASFTVYAGGVAVEVLGTSFNVQDRRGQTQVVLSSGQVKLKLVDRQETLHMQPGDLIRVTEREEKVEQRMVDPLLYSSWKDHTLLFQDTPLQEIAQLLEDTYGYEVRIRNPDDTRRRFTGSVPSDDIGMLLDKLSTVFGLRVRRSDRVIMLE